MAFNGMLGGEDLASKPAVDQVNLRHWRSSLSSDIGAVLELAMDSGLWMDLIAVRRAVRAVCVR